MGAQPRDVFLKVLQEGLSFALIGIGLGFLAAYWLTGFIANLLYHTRALDPQTLIEVAVVLVVVALAACLLPARRAAQGRSDGGAPVGMTSGGNDR